MIKVLRTCQHFSNSLVSSSKVISTCLRANITNLISHPSHPLVMDLKKTTKPKTQIEGNERAQHSKHHSSRYSFKTKIIIDKHSITSWEKLSQNSKTQKSTLIKATLIALLVKPFRKWCQSNHCSNNLHQPLKKTKKIKIGISLLRQVVKLNFLAFFQVREQVFQALSMINPWIKSQILITSLKKLNHKFSRSNFKLKILQFQMKMLN